MAEGHREATRSALDDLTGDPTIKPSGGRVPVQHFGLPFGNHGTDRRAGGLLGRKPSVSTSKRHMTVAEVCEELGVAKSTFHDWRAKGRGPRCIKLPNGKLRIRRSDFEAWLSGHEDVVA